MPGRLAVDFGTPTRWSPSGTRPSRGRAVSPARLRQADSYRRGPDGDERMSVVPSLIHYAADNRRWLGQQVHERKASTNRRRTFRWMKRYIAHRSPLSLRRRRQGRFRTSTPAGISSPPC